jgi:acyl transferase domain-containing protein
MSFLTILRKIKNKLTGDGVHPSTHYEYHLDACFNHVVKGWAYRKASPQQPVHVAFKVGNRTFCEVMANESRDDLITSNLPSKSCAFSVSPDLPQASLTPTLADLYLDGVKVNIEPIVFAMDYQQLLLALKNQELPNIASSTNK